MPRMLARAGILVALLVPSFAFAAFDDVTLTTDTVLSVGGITLNVSGSNATIESITVNATSFSVTLLSGSFFQVTAPGLERLTTDTLTGVSSNLCSTLHSTLAYQPSSAITATITPVTPSCASASAGGGVTTSANTTAATLVVTPVATTTTSTASTTPATLAPPKTFVSGLSSAQIQSILDVLASFDADADIIAKVKASLEGTAATGSVTSAVVHVFKANLTTGSLGSEVKALQVFLNAHGYTVAQKGPGSSGNETTRFGPATTAALIKYQKAKGITPAVGYFGPKTRAAINLNP